MFFMKAVNGECALSFYKGEAGMKVIYENEIKALGESVSDFVGGNMFIIFGENAPEELREYCYLVSVNPVCGDIEPGQILKIDDNEYKITAVGAEAPRTLARLGHMTVNMSGRSNSILPGTLYTEHAEVPEMGVGTKIVIYEDGSPEE